MAAIFFLLMSLYFCATDALALMMRTLTAIFLLLMNFCAADVDAILMRTKAATFFLLMIFYFCAINADASLMRNLAATFSLLMNFCVADADAILMWTMAVTFVRRIRSKVYFGAVGLRVRGGRRLTMEWGGSSAGTSSFLRCMANCLLSLFCTLAKPGCP